MDLQTVLRVYDQSLWILFQVPESRKTARENSIWKKTQRRKLCKAYSSFIERIEIVRCISNSIYVYYHMYIYSAVTWRGTVHEHIVADAFRYKKSLSALLVHEQQASQKWYLSTFRRFAHCLYSHIYVIYI